VGDVTHLRGIYEYLSDELDKSGRAHWVQEELSSLTAAETYTIHPEDAWKRLKTRTNSGRFLGVAKELARFRESYAQSRNIPRKKAFQMLTTGSFIDASEAEALGLVNMSCRVISLKAQRWSWRKPWRRN
jgi:hypothetical protein